MKVKCIANTGAGFSSKTRQNISCSARTILPIKRDDVYTVYGQVIWRGVLHYLIVGSGENFPSLYPAEIFSVVDSLLPIEFYFRYWREEEISAIWGFEELVENQQFLFDLIEREREAIGVFLLRKDEIDSWLL